MSTYIDECSAISEVLAACVAVPLPSTNLPIIGMFSAASAVHLRPILLPSTCAIFLPLIYMIVFADFCHFLAWGGVLPRTKFGKNTSESVARSY